LPDQIPVQAPELGLVGDVRTAAKAAGQRGGKKRLSIECAIDRVNGTIGGFTGDAGRLDLSEHAEAPTASEGHLGTRDGLGHAVVIDGSFGSEPRDRSVDVLGSEALSREPLPHLHLGQLPSSKHPQGGHVGASSG